MESTAIRGIAYDPAKRRLYVTFVSGERYAYEDVSAETHASFLSADSKGRFFQAQVRDRYTCRKLS